MSKSNRINPIACMLYSRMAATQAGFKHDANVEEALTLLLAAINAVPGRSLAGRAEACAAASGWLQANVARTMVEEKTKQKTRDGKSLGEFDDFDNACEAVEDRASFWMREYIIIHQKACRIKKS